MLKIISTFICSWELSNTGVQLCTQNIDLELDFLKLSLYSYHASAFLL